MITPSKPPLGSKKSEAGLRVAQGPPPGKKKVFIVDDHAVFREGLRELINGSEELLVCGESESSEDALQRIPLLKPDIALVDLTLGGASGMELLKSLSSRHPEIAVLILTMHDESFFAERALRAGAKGYIMKHQAIREIKVAILQILNGHMYVSKEMTGHLLQSVAKLDKGTAMSPLKLLSDREIEVFEMIGKGFGTSDISQALHLGIKTVETYRSRIRLKLGLRNGTALRQQALQWVFGSRLSGESSPSPAL